MKKLLAILLAGVLLCMGAACFAGCAEQAKNYTEQEHIERVSKLVEDRYMRKDSGHTAYEVRPLYDETGQLAYFVVDFQPKGYVYIKINERATVFAGMYTRDLNEGQPWFPYTVEIGATAIVPTEGGAVEYENRLLQYDENGAVVLYSQSYFRVTKIQEEKCYLLKVIYAEDSGRKEEYIPAVKREEGYLNLVSLEKIDYVSEVPHYTYATSDISFLEKNEFDL